MAEKASDITPTSSINLLDERDVARTLLLSTRTVSRLRNQGKIGFHRLPGGQIRFTAEDVEAFIAQCHRPASGQRASRKRKRVARKVQRQGSRFSLREFDRSHDEKGLGIA